MEFGSFTANGRAYVLNAKIGSNPWGSSNALLEEKIHSIAQS
jgi:hypothetical protein